MKYEITSYASKKIRSEMLEKGVQTKEICKLLFDTFELKLNEQSFNNKISRTTFSATFFFQCMYVLETWLINFDRSNIAVTNKENDNGTRK
jgi:proteasome lid subunit RPN8/RPN11